MDTCNHLRRSLSKRVKRYEDAAPWEWESMVQFDGLTLARTGTHSDLFGKRCAILFGLLFDYYRERPRKPCDARLPRFSHKMPQISAIPTKPFCRNGSRLDGLITPSTVLYPTELNAINPCAAGACGVLKFGWLNLYFSGQFNKCMLIRG